MEDPNESDISHKLQESGQVEVLPGEDKSSQRPPVPPVTQGPPLTLPFPFHGQGDHQSSSSRFAIGNQDLDPFSNKGTHLGQGAGQSGMLVGPSHPIFHDVQPTIPAPSAGPPFATLPP